jgi:DNA modification methylase
MTYQLLHGDCLDILPTLAAGSVHCVVTSPPYYGLRDYGTADWDGGDAECDHVQRTNKHGGTSNRPGLESQTYEYRDICGKCGAVRVDRQIGLEQTPEEYVAKLVAVFREVRRVLRDDGVCFLNLGDSYAGAGYSNHANTGGAQVEQGGKQRHLTGTGLKNKDLIGIPWRVAFALQADGWYLRQDIIWAKPNPMPESVTDRCTKAHEYVFLLTKAARYWYDNEAVKEDSVDDASYKPRTPRNADKREGDKFFQTKVGNHANGKMYPTRNRRSVFTCPTKYMKMRDDLPEETKKKLVAELLRRDII